MTCLSFRFFMIKLNHYERITVMIEEIIKDLSANADTKREAFTNKIIPNCGNSLGLRNDDVIKYVKKHSDKMTSFLNLEPHRYYETDLIRAYSLAKIDISFVEKLPLIKEFSKTINNWAVCDFFVGHLKIKKEELGLLYEYAISLLPSEEEFVSRLGIVILLGRFVNVGYINKWVLEIRKIKTGKYYIDMGYAWLLSVMCVKFPNEFFKFMESANLTNFVLRKTISKIQDSFRVSDEIKQKAKKLIKKDVILNA